MNDIIIRYYAHVGDNYSTGEKIEKWIKEEFTIAQIERGDVKNWEIDLRLIYGNVFEINKCQFTGLRDKNGKEIYEGDILRLNKDDNLIGQVVFESGCFCFVEINGNDYEFFNHFRERQFEVIGNIYEDKELKCQ